MLQHTRVDTVIPYYEKWLKRFPTVRALAKASEREVLNAWEGLGYYSRARNFYKAVKIVDGKYGGGLPRDLNELQKLPGIGRYTVGALASILFGMDEPALDGNLKRVYARLFDVSLPVDSTEGEAFLWKLARAHLPKGKPADFNQACDGPGRDDRLHNTDGFTAQRLQSACFRCHGMSAAWRQTNTIADESPTNRAPHTHHHASE